jgi:type IV pilus assembly protein PilN
MLRINLLPIKQERRREAGRNQLLFGFLVIVVELVAFTIIYMNTSAELNAQKNANNAILVQVDRIKKQVKDHKRILSEIEDYEKRQASIDDLLAARTGPVFVMLELSAILSKGGKPTFDHDRYQQLIQSNPSLALDEGWDNRMLWLETFKEKDRLIKLTGQGLTHEDVAEFLRRLNLSDFFVSSNLVSTNLAQPRIPNDSFDLKNADAVVHFVIDGKVRYQ